MARPKFTVTIGGAGQRVVKESRGSKGLKTDALSSRADGSHYSIRKRIREDVTGSSTGNKSKADGSEDLRLKLLRKKLSRYEDLETEERKKSEFREKMSRAIHAAELPEESHVRKLVSSRGAAEPLQKDYIGSSHAFLNQTPTEPRATNVRARSPDRLPRPSSGVSIPRTNAEENLRGNMDSSRPRRVFLNDPLESSRRRITSPTNFREPLDCGNLVRQQPPEFGMSCYPYTDKQAVTVSTFLESIGLEKYRIQFQHEEIDMLALRQLGERDLKDLGIPMGPRKKILLALEARMKHQVAPRVCSNYLR